MPRRRPGWTRFIHPGQKRDQTRKLEHFHELINLGNALAQDAPMNEHTPTQRDLRNFGLTLGCAVIVLFGLIPPLLLAKNWSWWPWILALSFFVWSVSAPNSLAWPYRIWMRIGFILNAVTSRIILSLVFFLLITPMGIIRRLVAGDPMNRKFDPNASSYRVKPENPRYKDMENPF